jgi:protein-S-isoprenylcysteine O-methyltransferase Ste14
MIRFFVTMPLWVCAVFASAGRINWARGWIWVAAYFVGIGMVAEGLLVRRKNPALIEARRKWRRKDTKPFDKVFLSIYIPLIFLQPIVAGLDAVRFAWSCMPFVTVYVGLVLLAMAITPVTWAMMVNPHAESTVRIQTDRDHKVVSSGPYRIVRHPIYIGAILMYPAIALILGSTWALAMSGVIAILFVWRTALEDRTLRRELPGYQEFASVTRYCLVPGVW